MGVKQEHNLRNIVLTMLVETLEKQGFSHILLQEAFSKQDLDPNEKAFITRLYLGTLEQVMYLDLVIDQYANTKVAKMKPVIRNILRMSLYQMLFMDSVPDHAAINEGVKLAEERGFRNLKGFVNGILRSIQRQGVPDRVPEYIRCGVPEWLYDLVVAQNGKEQAELFFAAVNRADSKVSARMNLREKSREEIFRMLEEDGCQFSAVEEVPEAVVLEDFSDLTGLRAYREGLLFYQDISAMYPAVLLAELTGADPVNQIVDVCAAPGGKSLHLAEKYPKAEILSRDLTADKVSLIEENKMRMRADNVNCQVFDALILDEDLIGKADIVIADLPCSGLGVIGNKPDIRYRVQKEDLKELSRLQRDILKTVQTYVSPNGFLSYSTCTINQGENEENARWFQESFPFEMIREKRFLPGLCDCDGAYVAIFRRKA